MTEEEIEAKAEEYAIKITDELKNKGFLTIGEISQRYAGIVQGAKWGAEHAIEWHDLRKDPNDLPKDEEDFKEYLVAHKNFNNPNEIVVGCFTWYGGRFLENYTYSEIPYFENKNVLYAWCELPQFKEGEE